MKDFSASMRKGKPTKVGDHRSSGYFYNYLAYTSASLPVDAVEYATLEWVDWFNDRRLLESIGNVPPAELEQAYYDNRETQAEADSLTQTSLQNTRGGSRTS